MKHNQNISARTHKPSIYLYLFRKQKNTH